MKITTNIPKIILARDLFNFRIHCVLTNLEHYKLLFPFTYTEDSCWHVYNKLKDFLASEVEIKIIGYKPWNPWSAAIGYTTKGSNTIHVNLRKLDSLTVADYAGNICHEICHLIGYSHGNNIKTLKKTYSVPYALGYLVSEEMTYEKLIYNPYLGKK